MPSYTVTVARTETFAITVDDTQTEPRALAEDYARQLFGSGTSHVSTMATTITRKGQPVTTVAIRET